MLMPSLDTSIANAGLPILATAFEATFQQVQWIVLAYLLAITTLIVSVGRLGDGFGRRRLLLIGIGIFTSASLACALAPGLGWLIGARAVQGVGAAIMFALTVALVADAVPKARAGSAMGLLATMSAGRRFSCSTCRWACSMRGWCTAICRRIGQQGGAWRSIILAARCWFSRWQPMRWQ
jgi:MFS family permease